MVLTLGRILAVFERRNSRDSLPLLDLARLSDHHLDDLNLPPSVKAEVVQRRADSMRFNRW